MINTIDLSTANGSWVATYSGPHADQIISLFGTATIPTAWRHTRPNWEVVADVQRLNPGVVVMISGLEVVLQGGAR